MTSELVFSELPAWFPPEKIEELESIAAIGYSYENMALYFDIPAGDFLHEIHRQDSKLMYHIQRGVLMNEARDAIAAQQSANTGNATQAQRLDKKKYLVFFQQLKEKIIYGKE
jgi:hypothetical protein